MCDIDELEFAEYLRYLEAARAKARAASALARVPAVDLTATALLPAVEA